MRPAVNRADRRRLEAQRRAAGRKRARLERQLGAVEAARRAASAAGAAVMVRVGGQWMPGRLERLELGGVALEPSALSTASSEGPVLERVERDAEGGDA